MWSFVRIRACRAIRFAARENACLTDYELSVRAEAKKRTSAEERCEILFARKAKEVVRGTAPTIVQQERHRDGIGGKRVQPHDWVEHGRSKKEQEQRTRAIDEVVSLMKEARGGSAAQLRLAGEAYAQGAIE